MSASDVVQPVVSEITKPMVQFIAKELDYLLRPKKYVSEMSLSVKSLKANYENINEAVVKAQGFGKEIKPEVVQWLESVGEIIALQEELLKDSHKRCLNGWCVDFGSRYKINKGAVGISERITKVLPRAPESTSVALPPPPPTLLSDPGFMEFESTKKTMNQILEALKDAECGVVGIFGMGGIGKTTIVKKISEMVNQDRQFDQVAMAVVSQSPDLKKIQGEIASMLDLGLNQEAGVEGRASQLRKRLMNLKSILVILDDVWAWLDLTTIGIPEHKGCKVMLTTRSEDVCTSMGRENGKKIKVGVLSKEESWELFKSNAGDGIDSSPLKEVAAMVMNECQCLPLAIKTVGRALRGKDIGVWISAKLDLSKSITTNIEGMSKEVISCLRLSYDYLEGKETKLCFLVCCLFPEDFNIGIEMLVRYAMGKGLFQHASTIDEARTLTQTTLGKLKASCLLLEGDNKFEECVKVHDVVRDVGLSIPSDEFKLVSRSGSGLGRLLQNKSVKNVKGACFTTEELVSLPEGIQCPELEELILRGRQVDYLDAYFPTMKELKVMIHLGPSRLPTSIKCSVSLRTLHLVSCQLGDISAALGEMKMLEILTINGTRIESLPMEVGKLTSLRLLDITKNYYLKRIPGKVISKLSQLEELCIGTESFDDWEIEGTSGDVEKASLSELRSLPCLAILFVGVRDFAQIPPKFYLPNKLVKFEIRVGALYDMDHYPMSRKLMLGRGEFQIEGVKSLLRLVDGHEGEKSSKYEFTSEGNGSKYVLTDLAGGGGGLNGLDSLKIQSIDWISYLTSCATTNDKVFANLQKLTLRNVWSLRGLASGEEIEGTATYGGVLPPGSLRHLKVLEIDSCHGLEGWVVPFRWTQRLHNLESVHIRVCENVTGLFEVSEEKTNSTNNTTPFLLSNLREIELYGLHQLRSLTNGELSSIRFSNLRVVDIYNCDSLDSIFPHNVCQSLVHLETLHIDKCSGLKVIFEEGGGSKSSSSQETQTSSTTTFPNLKIVTVDNCPQLKTLFTVSMAIGLLKLEMLHLHGNSELEETVSSNKNSAAVAAKEKKENNDSITFTWPQLRIIDMKDSRQLKRFCPGNSCIEMPMLQVFYHTNCSDGMTNFAADPSAHGLKIPQSANIVTENHISSRGSIHPVTSDANSSVVQLKRRSTIMLGSQVDRAFAHRIFSRSGVSRSSHEATSNKEAMTRVTSRCVRMTHDGQERQRKGKSHEIHGA